MEAYPYTTTNVNGAKPSAPSLDNIIIQEPNIEIPKTLHEGSIINSEEDHIDNKDNSYEYLILNPKYYKKGMLSDKGKGIL